MPVPYADTNDFKLAFDERALKELGSDTDADGTVNSGNAIIQTALVRASDEVRTFTLRGGVYTAAQLDQIQSSGDWALKGLVCDIAFGILIARRGGAIPDSVAARLEKADRTLRDLRDGKLVFGSMAPTKLEASLPSVSVIPAQVRGNLGMASDQPFFPRRRTEEY
jgi:hypothetical protein